MQKIVTDIKNYIPFNEQEAADQEIMQNLLKTQTDLFERSNRTAHMTASAWVVNQDRTKVLMIYHNIYHSWSWLGGHADGDTNLLAVATREVQEESGLQMVKPVTSDLFSLEILTVDGHEKRGNYVSSHLHLNVTYLFEADEAERIRIKPDENSGVAWFGLDESIEKSSEVWFRERIYPKLNQKLRQM